MEVESVDKRVTLEHLSKKVAAVACTAASLFITTGLHQTQEPLGSFHSSFDESWIVGKLESKNVRVDDSVAKKLPWLSEFYQHAHSAHTAREVLPVISGIKHLFAEKQYQMVSDILLELEINKLSHTAMVALISAAYPARHKLESWSLGVAKVKIALSNDGLDAEEILKGLI
ncbi:hypothetical protein [Vibrio parahaemolyticus]|uniref:hypothetical protein n=1 Tax=Vibrio parahaemolyticus TaxID=670 RepID=UPI002362C914|nr:hypothetical protein [Vibrio parahaemolyticus]